MQENYLYRQGGNMWKKIINKILTNPEARVWFSCPCGVTGPCLVWPFHFMGKSLSVRKCRLRHLGFHLLLINKETVDIAPERWIYLGSAENWNSGPATMISPPQAKEGELFYRGEKEVKRLWKTKNPWLFIGWILTRREEEPALSLMALLSAEGIRAPLLISHLYLIELWVYQFFLLQSHL